MRKWIAWMLTCALLAGCAALAGAAPLNEADITLTYDGRTYTLRSDPAALIAAIEKHDGSPMQVEEADSCQFRGKDKEFYGTGKNGGDLLESIVVTGGIWKTERGIGIGSTRKAVLAAYGEGVEDYDQLLYAIKKPYESPTLIFQFDLETDQVIYIFLLACSA